MEIQEIKQRLTMAMVLSHYNLKRDKHLRLCCPFHEDKTPSMQVYYKTHTAYCISSNCPTRWRASDACLYPAVSKQHTPVGADLQYTTIHFSRLPSVKTLR
jgi:hypothetical protein